MSGLLAGKVWQSNLDGTLKPLAACLADIGSDDGSNIYPSVEYTCWLMSKSPRAVQYQLRKLEDMGILMVVSEPSGKAGVFKEYQMIEGKLPKRKKWKDYKLGAKTAPGQVGAKNAELGANSDELGAIPDISPYRDPSYDPSIPAKVRTIDKPKAPDPMADDRADLLTFLIAEIGELSSYPREVKAINWLLAQGYSADQAKRCWQYLDTQDWRNSAITWLTVKKEIGTWIHKGEPLVGRNNNNGNGKTNYGSNAGNGQPARVGTQLNTSLTSRIKRV